MSRPGDRWTHASTALALVIAVSCTSPARAQDGDGPRTLPPTVEAPGAEARDPSDCEARAFRYVRSEENASQWSRRACDRDSLDRLRYIEINDSNVLSLGGEVRARYEIDDSETFTGTQGDGDGAYFARAYLFADWQADVFNTGDVFQETGGVG